MNRNKHYCLNCFSNGRYVKKVGPALCAGIAGGAGDQVRKVRGHGYGGDRFPGAGRPGPPGGHDGGGAVSQPEKEIGGQLELVRLQAGIVRRGIARFNSVQPPLDVDELGV